MSGFEDLFGKAPGADVFQDMSHRYARIARGEPPPVKKCATKAELSTWLREFANACHAARG